MSATPTCPGYCCEAFNVGSPAEFEANNAHQPEYEQVRDLVVYLGQFEGNPTGRTACGKISTKPCAPGDRVGGHFHSCRAWDTETRLCTIYETRPSMCRRYPNRDACAFDGCDMGPTEGPYAGKTKTEVLKIREQEAKMAQDKHLHRVLAQLPEIQPTGMQRVYIRLTRPAIGTLDVSMLVPEGSDEAQILRMAREGLATAEVDGRSWQTVVVDGGDITPAILDMEDIRREWGLAGRSDGKHPIIDPRPWDGLVEED